MKNTRKIAYFGFLAYLSHIGPTYGIRYKLIPGTNIDNMKLVSI